MGLTGLAHACASCSMKHLCVKLADEPAISLLTSFAEIAGSSP